MRTPLGTTHDSTGEEVLLFFSETVGSTNVLPLFLRVYAEIVEKGWSNPVISFSNTNRVVWAERPSGVVVGGIAFDYAPTTHLSWIVLSFTAPDERGKGINAICHATFEQVSKKLGARQVCSLVHVNNSSRLRSAEKIGLKPQFYRMQKEL